MHWIGLLVQMVMHIAEVTWNFTLQRALWENAKLKSKQISTLQSLKIMSS